MGTRSQIIEDLQRQIDHLERAPRRRSVLPFGVRAVDAHLPGNGLALGALHEMIEAGPASEFSGAASLFIAGIAARLNGSVLWCLSRRDLFGPGLVQAGLHPNRVIYVETTHERDVLPLVEEGLHEKGLGAVVGEITRLGLTASRRLQLAAETSGVPALILRRWWTVAEKDLTRPPTAASTRWRITPVPSETLPAPGLGRARWEIELLRCRGAEPRSWILEACDAKGRLAVPSALAGRPDQTPIRRASGQ